MIRGTRRAALLSLAVGLALACERDAPPADAPPADPPAAAADASARARSSVLLITVDTLRADRLGVYGHALDTSPSIDALAARGARFADATVQWPKTWPSLASFLTGAHPRTTGIGAIPRVLPESLTMLAEVFRDAGYETAAIVSNFNAGRTAGFSQGFDHFVESWQERWRREEDAAEFVNSPGRVKEYTNATLVTDQALRWLWSRTDPSRPFFLWVHYMDPHGPYVPPAAYAELYAGVYPSSEIPEHLLPPYQRQHAGGHLITDLGFYQAQYDREVRYLDHEVGRLLDTIAWSAPDDLLVVLTADHGESLGEHDYYLEHGALSYQPTAHVPLVVVQPGVVPPGLVIEHPVGLLDASATIVELAGLDVPPTFEGTSLAGRLRGDPDAAMPPRVFMQSGSVPNAPQLTVREGRWKLVRVAFPPERRLMTGSEYELYDLATDPGELENVAAAHPDVVARLSGILDAWYADRPAGVESGDALDVEELDDRTRALLEALGYLEPGADRAGAPTAR